MAKPIHVMNEATINIFNANAFAPVQPDGRTLGDPLSAPQNDPVTTAIARAFGRIAFGLLLVLVAAVSLLATATGRAPAPVPGQRAQSTPASAQVVAPANP